MFDLEDGRVGIDGEDVAAAIRTAEIDQAAAIVARHPAVRRAIVERQRQMGEGGGVVMEGRDIGTVVFPNADVKIYLDASTEERARRRLHDTAHTARQAGQSAVAASIAARDEADTTRAASPLAAAADAVVIDTTAMPISEVVARVLALARAKLTENL